MSGVTVFITGTDTGVGKTVLASLLVGCLREDGLRVAGLKPVCSGGREDALSLWRQLDGALSLDEVNPWHFRAALAPVLAARAESKKVFLKEVVARARAVRTRFEVTVIEGAGGLLSPLGEDFNARDLILKLRAWPIVVCCNRLGAVNQALLVVNALPAFARGWAPVVLMNPSRLDAASRTNPTLLGEALGARRICQLPWLRGNRERDQAKRALHQLWDRLSEVESTKRRRQRKARRQN